MRKKILAVALIAAGVIGAGAVWAGQVAADETGDHPFAARIAEKIGLNRTEVEDEYAHRV